MKSKLGEINYLQSIKRSVMMNWTIEQTGARRRAERKDMTFDR